MPPIVSAREREERHIYGVITTLDRDGRLADRSAVTRMGWKANDPVSMHVTTKGIVVARAGGAGRVTKSGYLRVPVSIRRRSGLAVRSRVLALPRPLVGEVILVPLAVVSAMVDRMDRPDEAVP